MSGFVDCQLCINLFLLPVPHRLGHCTYLVGSPEYVIRFFKILWAVMGSLHFRMNFRISLSISAHASWDCVQFVDQLGEYCHLS